ncbi:restriction endonuclease subunit S [Chryseobacterium viscerum]|uniref:Type I restriction modification DNA specificity domain-containing protein n=1 Tax=Chryseobacterium viscerum TaxID=1037377 RepID=A0A316WP32_9FLAO|nr:restriction endonuclease subunit S [Chryseobacterium viscerum]PWN62957.1 hypothetical protein C1634_009300 [Chryseobacterium viscerum]
MIKFNKISFQNDIPDTWSRIPLYELRNKKDRYGFTGGPFGSDLKSEHYTQSGVKILQLQNIGEGKFIDKGIVYTSEQKANELISCNIYPGEIILAKMAPVARCCKVPSTDERYVMCSDGIRLSVDTHRFDNEFVFQALNSKYFRDEAESKSTGTTRARIGLNELKQICLSVPNSVPEQQKIAEILSTVDEKIEVIDQQISETQELKKGLMQSLLTKGIGHTEFKESPLGMIPESWEVVKLNKIGSLSGGNAFKATAFNTEKIGLQVIRMSNIQPYGLALKKNPVFINSISDKESKFLLKKGDLLITLTGTIGKTDYGNLAYIEESNSMVLNQRVGRFEYNEKSFGKFLYYVFSSEYFRNNFFEQGKGGTGNQANVGKEGFESIQIVFPSKIEQKKIAEILNSVDDKLEVLSEKKTYYQELKQGLMQQLLTGKIRVKI